MHRVWWFVAVVAFTGAAAAYWAWPWPGRRADSGLTFSQDAAWFKDVTDDVGLHFLHDAGPTGSYFMPQIMGSGAALFDANDDGLLDIYLLQNAGPASGAPNSTARNQLFQQ